MTRQYIVALRSITCLIFKGILFYFLDRALFHLDFMQNIDKISLMFSFTFGFREDLRKLIGDLSLYKMNLCSFFCCVSNFIIIFVMRSGMLVQDPTRRNDVDAIFEQARQAGAIHGMPPVLGGESSSSRSFTGTGRLLTGETVPSAAPQEPVPVRIRHNIHLWNNGFTVDDGPLRFYDDPENAEFLEVIPFTWYF